MSTPLLFLFYLARRSIQFSELDGVHEFNGRLAGVYNRGHTGGNVGALDVDYLTGSLGFSLGLIVGAHAVLEGLSAGGHADVLDADVKALGEDLSTNALVADNTDGVLGHVEDLSSLTVVVLVGHTSLDSSISNDIDVVSLAVGDEELAKGRNTVLAETS
jgi:hypothetical protein